jgi:hypothetical protein
MPRHKWGSRPYTSDLSNFALVACCRMRRSVSRWRRWRRGSLALRHFLRACPGGDPGHDEAQERMIKTERGFCSGALQFGVGLCLLRKLTFCNSRKAAPGWRAGHLVLERKFASNASTSTLWILALCPCWDLRRGLSYFVCSRWTDEVPIFPRCWWVWCA